MNYRLKMKKRAFLPRSGIFFLCFFSWIVFSDAQTNYPKYEFRGVWVATVNNIDWPSQPGLTTDQQKKEVIDILNMHSKNGMNAIILQVRPCSDAFYLSAIEPWSRYLAGTPGRYPDPFWDPLQFWIEECHKRNMELHAWLNPYRIAQHADEPLAGNHQVFSKPEWVIQYDGKLLFDPGIPGTRDYVTSVVCDIVRRYDVDGIHMDDYFYPYPTRDPFPDDGSFARFNRAFSPEEKSSWRRENVDILIKMISDSVKSIKPWVKIGISPFGVWRNQRDDPGGSATTAGVTNYDDLYADIRKWLLYGWIDYVTPQIYWEIGHKAADFKTLCKWWNDNSFGHDLYIGMAPFKLSRKATVAAWRNPGELPAQLRMMRMYPNIKGSIYFSSKSFKNDLFGFQDSLLRKFYRYPALPPVLKRLEAEMPGSPVNVSGTGRKVRWEPPAVNPGVSLPYRYIVYISEKGKPFDREDPSCIAGITGQLRSEFAKTGKKRRHYEVRITTLDRFNHESEPSEPAVIRL